MNPGTTKKILQELNSRLHIKGELTPELVFDFAEFSSKSAISEQSAIADRILKRPELQSDVKAATDFVALMEMGEENKRMGGGSLATDPCASLFSSEQELLKTVQKDTNALSPQTLAQRDKNVSAVSKHQRIQSCMFSAISAPVFSLHKAIQSAKDSRIYKPVVQQTQHNFGR